MEALSDVVARRTFSQAKRGYDVREVEAFVSQIVDRIRALESQIATSHGKLNAFERTAGAEKDAGLVVRDAFRVATNRRDEIIEDAKKRAEAIVAEAQQRVAGVSADRGVARAEAAAILAQAREEAGRLVASAERRAREIIRVARAQADQEAASAMVDAREAASDADVEYRRIARQLKDLKSAVNRMLQEGAAGHEEIRVVFASDGASSAS